MFFDVTPSGRIINRFAKDLDSVDTYLPDFMHDSLTTFGELLATLMVCAVSSPAFLMVVPGLLWYTLRTRALFSASSRELKRMEAVNRSPIFTCFSEAASGIATIRAFGQGTAATSRWIASWTRTRRSSSTSRYWRRGWCFD
jgi:ABC-type multidrug transport system fused ATPase/permease subunit